MGSVKNQNLNLKEHSLQGHPGGSIRLIHHETFFLKFIRHH